jgi:hypothetical protein
VWLLQRVLCSDCYEVDEPKAHRPAGLDMMPWRAHHAEAHGGVLLLLLLH